MFQEINNIKIIINIKMIIILNKIISNEEISNS